MTATTMAVVVPAEKAAQIDNIFTSLVSIGCQLTMSNDGIRDGIALRRVFKKHSTEAQRSCLAAGVLVAEGWLSMIVVQGQIKGFIRKYPRVAPKETVLRFPAASGPSMRWPTRVRHQFCRSSPMMSVRPLRSGGNSQRSGRRTKGILTSCPLLDRN